MGDRVLDLWVRDVTTLTIVDFQNGSGTRESEATPPSDCDGEPSFLLVWGAATVLLDYLERNQKSVVSQNCASSGINVGDHADCKTMNVLELGSGTGWLGLTLARNVCPCVNVYLTELPRSGAHRWLTRNKEHNQTDIERIMTSDHARPQVYPLPLTNAHVVPFDWRWLDPGRVAADSGGVGLTADSDCSENIDELQLQFRALLSRNTIDVVLGSDLVYSDESCDLLPKILYAILEQQAKRQHQVGHAQEDDEVVTASAPRVLYAHTTGRYEFYDRFLLENFTRCGLTCEVVWEEEDLHDMDKVVVVYDLKLANSPSPKDL